METNRDDNVELSARDERARRLAGLALTFSEGGRPVPSAKLREAFYPDLTDVAFNKALKRDLAALAESGLVVDNLAGRGEDGLWQAREGSFVGELALSGEEAALIDLACAPLLDDPSFAWRDELRLALAKVDDSFSGTFPAPVAKRSGQDPIMATLLACETGHLAVEIGYTRADGSSTRRVVAPYGHYPLLGRVYFVGPRLDAEEGAEPHTYRFDRISSARALPHQPFSLPEDFDVAAWVRLPFQLGPSKATCAFLVPDSAGPGAREALDRFGSLVQDGRGRTTWRVGAHDVALAARWAAGEGLLPLSPPSLVDEWRKVLGEAAGNDA